MTNASQPIIQVHTGKSFGVAILLTILLGPLGMFYSTVTGAIIMLVASLILFIITFGFSLLLTWPICIVWSAFAASDSNSTVINRW